MFSSCEKSRMKIQMSRCLVIRRLALTIKVVTLHRIPSTMKFQNCPRDIIAHPISLSLSFSFVSSLLSRDARWLLTEKSLSLLRLSLPVLEENSAYSVRSSTFCIQFLFRTDVHLYPPTIHTVISEIKSLLMLQRISP